MRIMGKEKKLEEILVKNSTYTNNTHIKKYLYESGLKEQKCEVCGITDWNTKKITLELEHINGDNFDHRIENLLILCPNCHSQTETYCSSSKAHGIYKTSYIKNGIEQKTNYCKVCNINIVPRNRKICHECIEIKNKREKIHYCK